MQPILNRLAALCAAFFLCAAPAGAASTWPSGPIRLVVPYGAGGSLDVIARVLATGLTAELGRGVIVENAPGGDGTVGVHRTLLARPDGYTFLVAISSNVTLPPLINASVDYHVSDLAAVAKVGTSGIVLAGRPDLKANTLPELAALSKTVKGGLTYGTLGVGSMQHLSMLGVSTQAGIDALLVPYNAAAQIASDVMGGHLDLISAGLPSLVPLIQQGKLKAYAVMSHDRDIGDPDIPALGEIPGLENLNFDLWTGVFAPKKTPQPIVQAMNQAIAKVLAKQEVIEQYRSLGVKTAQPMTPEAFSDFVLSDEKQMRELVEKAGIGRDSAK